jgi:hypothetical protein
VPPADLTALILLSQILTDARILWETVRRGYGTVAIRAGMAGVGGSVERRNGS